MSAIIGLTCGNAYLSGPTGTAANALAMIPFQILPWAQVKRLEPQPQVCRVEQRDLREFERLRDRLIECVPPERLALLNDAVKFAVFAFALTLFFFTTDFLATFFLARFINFSPTAD